MGEEISVEGLPADATTPEGKKVTLTRDDWLHVRFRHPEVGTNPTALLRVVSHPDETHRDRRGGYHALKRIDQRHFLVVIYELTEGREGLIRTAFIIDEKRKNRRYREQ
jgi:hypothetical protein